MVFGKFGFGLALLFAWQVFFGCMVVEKKEEVKLVVILLHRSRANVMGFEACADLYSRLSFEIQDSIMMSPASCHIVVIRILSYVRLTPDVASFSSLHKCS